MTQETSIDSHAKVAGLPMAALVPRRPTSFIPLGPHVLYENCHENDGESTYSDKAIYIYYIIYIYILFTIVGIVF